MLNDKCRVGTAHHAASSLLPHQRLDQRVPEARWRSLYPYRSHFLDIDGHRIHYVDEGDGRPVLMLHGNPTWSFMYRRLIAGLSDAHRVIAPDHIGCGLSEKPQKYNYTLATHIDNLEQLVDHLDLQNLTLVVHDWGGAIGFGYAVRYPERVCSFIVLNSAAFTGPGPLRIRACTWPLLGTLAVRVLNGFSRGALRFGCVRRECLTREVREGFLAPYDTFRNRVAVHRFVQDIPFRPSHPTYPLICEIDAGLAKLADKPLMLTWGMRDFCFHEWFLNEWIRRFPQAEVHRFADAGHYVLEDAHERILPLARRFLSH